MPACVGHVLSPKKVFFYGATLGVPGLRKKPSTPSSSIGSSSCSPRTSVPSSSASAIRGSSSRRCTAPSSRTSRTCTCSRSWRSWREGREGEAPSGCDRPISLIGGSWFAGTSSKRCNESHQQERIKLIKAGSIEQGQSALYMMCNLSRECCATLVYGHLGVLLCFFVVLLDFRKSAMACVLPVCIAVLSRGSDSCVTDASCEFNLFIIASKSLLK